MSLVVVSIIAAVAENGVIGAGSGLPWHLPADLRRFKQLTTGHHLILGRVTWETVGRPLPGRPTIVVTRRRDYAPPGVRTSGSVEAAIAIARDAGDDEPFVAGGAEIYREALERDLIDRLYLTRIHRAYEGDTRFPDYDESRWRLVASEPHPAEPDAGRPAFDFLVYERARAAG